MAFTSNIHIILEISHFYNAVSGINHDFCGFAHKRLVNVTGNKAVQTVYNVAESLIPVNRRARVDAAARTMRHGE
jgi:hypothetical protein